MSTLKTTSITHASNSGTANLTLASDGGVTIAGSLSVGSLSSQTGPVWWGTQDTAHALTQNTAVKLVNLGNDAINTTGWDESTGTFTVPSGKGGIYFLTAACGIDHHDSNEVISIYVYVNGSEVGPRGYTITDGSTTNNIKQVNATWVRSLSAGDTVAIWATTTENDGGITTVTNMTWFGGYKIA